MDGTAFPRLSEVVRRLNLLARRRVHQPQKGNRLVLLTTVISEWSRCAFSRSRSRHLREGARDSPLGAPRTLHFAEYLLPSLPWAVFSGGPGTAAVFATPPRYKKTICSNSKWIGVLGAQML